MSVLLTALRSGIIDLETEDDRFSITQTSSTRLNEGVYFAALDLFENPGLRERPLSLS